MTEKERRDEMGQDAVNDLMEGYKTVQANKVGRKEETIIETMIICASIEHLSIYGYSTTYYSKFILAQQIVVLLSKIREDICIYFLLLGTVFCTWIVLLFLTFRTRQGTGIMRKSTCQKIIIIGADIKRGGQGSVRSKILPLLLCFPSSSTCSYGPRKVILYLIENDLHTKYTENKCISRRKDVNVRRAIKHNNINARDTL